IKELYALAAERNVPSINIMEKIGMEKMDEFDHPLIIDGHSLQTHVIYHIALEKRRRFPVYSSACYIVISPDFHGRKAFEFPEYLTAVPPCEKLAHVFLMEEAFIDQFSEKLQEFIVETGCIQKPDRLFVKTDLPPCKHFKKLFECSGTAGKRNDCIPEFLHHFLALMHRLHYFQVLYFFVCHLPVHEELGDDAGHFSSVVKGAVGDSAHETDSAASVYNTDAAFCKTGPEFIGGLDIDGSVPR